MFVLRATQMSALNAQATRAFEDRTYAHLARYFPRHCQLLGETQMRLAIRHGWATATRHGLAAECCVRTVIELTCVLGGGFDADPLLPWASQLLGDRSSGDEVARGDRLYEAAWRYVDAIVPDYRDQTGQPWTARFVDELREIRQLDAEPVPPGPNGGAERALTESLQARIERVFPAKCGCVGPAAVERAIALAIAAARGHGITSERGLTSFAAMRFVLGAGFDADPLLPWASQALEDDPAVPDPNQRADRLFAAGVGFLRQWWNSAPPPPPPPA